MGTRGLTIVLSDGTHKVAQYGQWDHYPRGQGLTALEFCREHLSTDEGIAAFKEKLKNTRFIGEEEHEKLWKDFGVDTSSGFVKYEVAQNFDAKYPSLSRDTGAKILSLINDAKEEVWLQDSYQFAADSLFCEWVWVVDLDNRTLAGYKGFNKGPISSSELFASLTIPDNAPKGYYQVRFAKAFALDDLPSEENFLKAFNEDDEEEEVAESKDDENNTSSNPKTQDEMEMRLDAAGFESYSIETDNDGQLIIYTGLTELNGKLVPLE